MVHKKVLNKPVSRLYGALTSDGPKKANAKEDKSCSGSRPNQDEYELNTWQPDPTPVQFNNIVDNPRGSQQTVKISSFLQQA
jgi:hypothetical protein